MTAQQAHELCEEYADAFRCLKKKDNEPNKDGMKAFNLFRRIPYDKGIEIVGRLKEWDPTEPRAQWSKPNAASLITRLEDETETQRIPTWLAKFRHGDMVSFVNRPDLFGIIDKEASEPVILVPHTSQEGNPCVFAISAADMDRQKLDPIPSAEFQTNRDYVLSREFGAYFSEWFRFLLDPKFTDIGGQA